MQNDGTSIKGIQLVLEDVDWSEACFLIRMSRSSVQPPRRAGYFWGELYTGGGNALGAIVYYGVLFYPGARVAIPNVGFGFSDRFRWWVDWNEAGVSWEVVAYDGPNA
jgi:hypothetical protein